MDDSDIEDVGFIGLSDSDEDRNDDYDHSDYDEINYEDIDIEDETISSENESCDDEVEYVEVPKDAFLPNNGVLQYRFHWNKEDGKKYTSKEKLKILMKEHLDWLEELNRKCLDQKPKVKSIVNTDVKLPGCPPCRLVNLVCTYNTRLELNSKKIAFWYKDIIPIKFNPKGFAALIFAVKMVGIPPTTILLYPSGNVVHTGAKSIPHARLSAWCLAVFFHKHLGIPLSIRSFRINNIVSNLDLKFTVNLEGLNRSLGVLSSYQPEKIQCVFIKGEEQRHLVVLVYASGSIVITGCRTMEDVEDRIRYIMETVPPFKDRTVQSSTASRHLHKKKGYQVPKITGMKRMFTGQLHESKPGVAPINPNLIAFKKLKFLPAPI